jgi:hypothetical protein
MLALWVPYPILYPVEHAGECKLSLDKSVSSLGAMSTHHTHNYYLVLYSVKHPTAADS